MTTIRIPIDLWARIVLAAQESNDWRLRALIEQAVAAANPTGDETR